MEPYTATTNSSSTSTMVGVSDEERRLYLEQLQANTTTIMLPAITFLIALAVTGFVGNSLVLFVYTQKMKASATRVLIITIAVFDLVANVIAIPGDVYDMFHIWDFDNPGLCRARMFFSAFTTLSSAMALLAVAVVRYRRVCWPYRWQITFKKAKLISCVVAILGIIFSIPYAVLNGHQTKKTPNPDISGKECTTDDDFVGTQWPLLNYAFFLVLYVFCCGPFTILYILIGVKAWRHRKIPGEFAAPTSSAKTKSKSACSMDRSTEIESPSTPDARGSNEEVNISKSKKISVCSYDTSDGIDLTDLSSVGQPAFKEICPLSESKESLDQYTVKILKDRIEIRTPIMGEIVINLQKTMSDFGESTDDVFEVGSVDQKQDNSVHDQAVNGNNEKTHNLQETRSETQSVKTDGWPENSESKIDNKVINDFLITLFNSDNHPENGCTETTFWTNTELETDEKLDVKSDDSPQTQTCQNSNRDGGCNQHATNSVSSEISLGSSDFDPVASLRWVDITYSQDKSEGLYNPSTSQMDTNFSFRISPSNKLLQRTEWLRNLMAEAISQPNSTERISQEISEVQTNNNVDTRLPHHEQSRDTKINKSPEVVENSSASSKNSPRKETSSVKKRLKDWVAKGNSLKKNGSQKERCRTRPIGRTTFMLIIISAVFSLGFVPHLGLMFFKFTSPEQYKNLTTVEQTFYNLFLRAYFLNCAANPIIYSLCDANFRRECFGLFKILTRRRF